MRTNILSLLIVLFSFMSLIAQGWVKQFPGDLALYGENVTQTSDGNFASAIIATDGLGSGMGPGAYLFKFDEFGATISLKKYADDIHPDGHAVYASPDGGYFILSSRVDPSSGQDATHLLKLDADLNEVASIFIDFENNLGVPQSTNLIVSNDNHIYLSRGTSLRKYELDLNQVSEIELDIFVADLMMTPEGEFVGVGIINFLTGAFKLSNDGQVIWTTDLSTTPPFGSFFVQPAPDDTYMLFSVRAPTAQGTFNQTKLDTDGTILWTKDITSLSSYFKQMWNQVPVSDGYISVGQVYNEIILEKGNLLLVKTDFEGEIIWERDLDVIENEYGYSIVPTSDDGVIGLSKFIEGIGLDYHTYFFRANSAGHLYDQKLAGKIGFDITSNCEIADVQNMENWYISATNNLTEQTHYTTTDSKGNYLLNIPTGVYTITVHPPNALWEVCDNNQIVGFVEDAQLTRDFPVIAAADCSVMAVQSILPVAIPCSDNNTFHITYCNEGTITAVDAYVEVTVEEELSYVNSTIPLSSQSGNTYTFLVGDVPIGECGNFQIAFLVDCDTEVSETVCIESEVFPNEDCIPNPSWNGAFIEGGVDCVGDSIVFALTNTGSDIMSTARNFIVIEDALMLKEGVYLLEEQETQLEKFRANGSTVILEAVQEQFAPGDPFVRVWIEGCGTNNNGEFSMGFVNQYSLGDNNPATDIDCRMTSDSYESNNNQGFPLGYGSQHFIQEQTDIEYLLRFQNIGNDTVYTVVLLDTIAPELDISTLRVGPASHDYEWTIEEGNVLRIEFSSIFLPGNAKDLHASNGFVEFLISQQPDLSPGTEIRNEAGIYFDFDKVVMTNETLHTIGLDFIINVSTQNPVVEAARIEVFPNPFNDFTLIKISDINLENGKFELFDLSGKLIFQQHFSGNEFKFHRNKYIANGNYFYKVSDIKKGVINSGQLGLY